MKQQERTTILMMVQYLVQILRLYVLCVIFVSHGSYGADSQYEACSGPRNCGQGPNISFPFYIEGLQESYCGFPGFMLHCNDHGFPVIDFAETKYVVQDIFYETRSFRVHDSATLTSNKTDCVPRIRNTTLPKPQFEYESNVTNLNLWSNCNDSWSKSRVSSQIVVCDGSRIWGIYDKDEGIENALENCGGNLVVPVEEDGDMGVGNVVQVLRRGFVIKWTSSDCSGCRDSGGYCGFNDTSYVFKCFCSDRPHSRTCIPGGKKRSLALVLGSGLGAVVVITSILISLIIAKRKMMKTLIIAKRKMMKNVSNDKDVELLLKQHGNLAPLRYRYLDLKKMTNSFSDKLGQGGYGSVYKAKTEDGRFLAVKILNEPKSNGEDFINEVVSNSKTSHVNIVSLLGFCFEGSKRALVYEFMPNGSLDKFIGYKSCLLRMDKLFEIALGIARGLEYLHQGCQMQILHFDIKPHNILLDKDFQPKISDFGLAKVCPNRASITLMSGTRGTAGYIAPEVFCRNFGKVSHKSDVYSYGMMVLDIVGERENIDQGTQNTSEKYFPHWIYKHLESNGDERIDGEEDEWEMSKRKVTIVGLWCIQTHPNDRPSMSKVVQMLEGNLDSLPIPPNPSLSSPSRPPNNASFSESSM